MLTRMRRGYTRDAYDALVERIRGAVPGVTFSTDIIVGEARGRAAAQLQHGSMPMPPRVAGVEPAHMPNRPPVSHLPTRADLRISTGIIVGKAEC